MGIGKRSPSCRSDKSLSVDISLSADIGYYSIVQVRTPLSVSPLGFDDIRPFRESQRDIGGIGATFRVMFAGSIHRHGLDLSGGARPNEESHLERGVVCG